MHRTARLRSGKDQQTESPAATTTLVMESKRRRLGSSSNNNYTSVPNNNGHQMVNGNGNGPLLMPTTGTRSQGRTRATILGNMMDADGEDEENTKTVNNNVTSATNPTSSEPLDPSDRGTMAISQCTNVNNDIEDPDDVDDSLSHSSSSDSSDSSDSEHSSEFDEESSEKKLLGYQESLHELESQFNYVKEVLYYERITQVDRKLEEIRCGRAKEYLSRLQELQTLMKNRVEVCGNLRTHRTESMNRKFEAQELAALQNFENDRMRVYQEIKSEIEVKIHRLEQDRNNDFTSDLWFETVAKKKTRKNTDLFGEKRKKPTSVTGPYVVYMLNEVDIVEDYSIIRKALVAPKRKYIEAF